EDGQMVDAVYWEAELGGHRCLIRRWKLCPLHVVELVSPMHLRSTLGLETGDRVAIDIASGLTEPVGVRRGLAWASVWMFRRHRFFADSEYARIVAELNPRAYELASQPLPETRSDRG